MGEQGTGEPGIVLPAESGSSQPPASVPQPSPLALIFRGPNGLRAGWRVLIFLAIVVALVAVASVVVILIVSVIGDRGRLIGLSTSALTPLGLSVSEGAIFLFTSIAALLMALIERRKFGQYGLPVRRAFGKDFWVGTIAGFLAISVCLLGIFSFHGLHFNGLGIHGSTLVTATAAWGATFVLVGLAEEFAFRGYLQFTLTTGMRFWPSAVLLSLLFGAAHKGNPGENAFGLLSVVLFGLLFCLFLRRTGNLWWAVGFHAGWDWGQTFFYGVPDSGIAPYHNLLNSTFIGSRWITGGSVGPEASVFAPIVLVIVALLFTRVYPNNQYQAP
jgi:uncharacterized protein